MRPLIAQEKNLFNAETYVSMEGRFRRHDCQINKIQPTNLESVSVDCVRDITGCGGTNVKKNLLIFRAVKRRKCQIIGRYNTADSLACSSFLIRLPIRDYRLKVKRVHLNCVSNLGQKLG